MYPKGFPHLQVRLGQDKKDKSVDHLVLDE